MNKKIILPLIIALLLIVSVQALQTGDLAYIDCENRITDQWNSNTPSWSGTSSYVSSSPTFNLTGNGGSKSCDFDGSTTLDFSSQDIKDISGSMAISMWLKKTSSLSSNMGIMQRGNWGGTGKFFLSYVNDSNGARYQFQHNDLSSDTRGEWKLNHVGNWIHYVVTFNSTDNSFNTFINGTKTTSSPSGSFSSINEIVKIGTSVHGSYIGGIDEIKFYDRALSDEEALNLFNCNDDSGCVLPDTTQHKESVFWDKQTGITTITNDDVYSTIITNSLTIEDLNLTTYGSGTIQMFSPTNTEVTCQMLFGNEIIASGTRTNLAGTIGSMNLQSYNYSFDLGNNQVEIRCKKTGSSDVSIGLTQGTGHVFNTNTSYYFQEIQDESFSGVNKKLLEDNITIPYSGYAIIDWNNFITNNNGTDQTVKTTLVTNKGNCSSFERYIQSGSSASTGGSCSFKVNKSEVFTATLEITGDNLNITHRPHLKILDMANYSILPQVMVSTTPAKIDSLTINNILNQEYVFMKAGLPVHNSGGTVNFYFNVSGNKTVEIPKTAGSGTEVLIMQEVFKADSGNFTIDLYAYTNSGTATLEKGDFQAYPVDAFFTNTTSFKVYANNYWNNETINYFNVSYDSTTIKTNNGEAIIFLVNQTKVNLTISSGEYFSHDFLNHDTSNDLTVLLRQNDITINVVESYSLNPITNWILKNGSEILVNTTSSTGKFFPATGNYNDVTIESKTGQFNIRSVDSFNVSSLENRTILYEILPTEFNITAVNFLTNNTINNFSVSYYSMNSSHSGTASTTTGELFFGVVNGETYNITIDAEGYALFNNNLIKEINKTSGHKFSLYTYNSIDFNFYDENDNSIITSDINILLTGSNVYQLNTSTGSLYVDELLDDTYNVKISSDDYTTKYYTLTVADRSHQSLNVFLSNSTQTASFTFQKESSGIYLEDVHFIVKSYIGDSWQIVSSKYSDVTGTVTINYLPDQEYRFMASKSGYQVKEFSLNPIERTEYTVLMQVTEEPSTSSQDDVFYKYAPTFYYEGNNTFNFTIASPLGSLENYYFNLSYPNGELYKEGVNSIGEDYSIVFNITNPEFLEQVRLEIHYETTLGYNVKKVFYFPIEVDNAEEGTWIKNKDNTYGLGLFERIIIATVLVLLISGIAFISIGLSAGIVSGIMIYAGLVVVGFIPLWSILLTVIIGFVLLIADRGRS